MKRTLAKSALACMLAGSSLTAIAAAQTASPVEDAGEDVIIVTSERRVQDIQDVAASVDTFSAEDLRLDGINSEFRNLQFSVTGLNISNQEGNLEVFIRGVGSANNTELGDPAVAPYINDVYVPRPRGFGVQFYDIERVEVRKGPQGTLRGRNAVGGTINIITARPELGTIGGYASIEAGAYNQRAYEGALNLPLGERAAVRFAAFSETNDPYFDNASPIAGIEAAGAEDEIAGRASFLWEPTDDITVDFVADYTNERGTGYPGSPLFQAFSAGFDFDDIDPREVVYRGPEGRLDNETYGFTGKIAYEGERFGMEYLSSFRSVDYFQLSGNTDGTAYPGREGLDDPSNFDNFGATYFTTLSDAYVNEFRIFAPDTNRFRWSLGAFRLDEQQEVGFFSVADYGLFFSGTEFSSPDIDVSSTAFFFDGTFDLTDRFRVVGGVRYTEEEKSRFGVGGNWTLGLGSEGFGCCFVTRLGTQGFVPALNERPNFEAPTTNPEIAQFLLEGATRFGANDTIRQQLAGVIDGTAPNGTCVDTIETDPNGTQSCPSDGQHSFFTLGAPAQQDGQVEEDFVDWRLGFEFDITEDHFFYAQVSTGTKASGFNDNLTPETAPAFAPEQLTAYEIGSKNVFDVMDGQRLVLNGSLFYYDYEDLVQQSLVQVGGTGSGDADSSGFSLLNDNVADARIFGLEIDGSLTLPYGFMVGTAASFLDTEVKEGTLADVRGQDFGVNDPDDADGDGCTNVCEIDLSGNELPLASDFQIITRLQQTVPFAGGELDWQILANYRSDYFLSIFNEQPVARPAASGIDCGGAPTDPIACGFAASQEGFWTVNLGGGYTAPDGRWRLEGYVTNLLDEDASQKALLGNSLNLRFLNLPRTGGVRLRVNF